MFFIFVVASEEIPNKLFILGCLTHLLYRQLLSVSALMTSLQLGKEGVLLSCNILSEQSYPNKSRGCMTEWSRLGNKQPSLLLRRNGRCLVDTDGRREEKERSANFFYFWPALLLPYWTRDGSLLSCSNWCVFFSRFLSLMSLFPILRTSMCFIWVPLQIKEKANDFGPSSLSFLPFLDPMWLLNKHLIGTKLFHCVMGKNIFATCRYRNRLCVLILVQCYKFIEAGTHVSQFF